MFFLIRTQKYGFFKTKYLCFFCFVLIFHRVDELYFIILGLKAMKNWMFI